MVGITKLINITTRNGIVVRAGVDRPLPSNGDDYEYSTYTMLKETNDYETLLSIHKGPKHVPFVHEPNTSAHDLTKALIEYVESNQNGQPIEFVINGKKSNYKNVLSALEKSERLMDITKYGTTVSQEEHAKVSVMTKNGIVEYAHAGRPISSNGEVWENKSYDRTNGAANYEIITQAMMLWKDKNAEPLTYDKSIISSGDLTKGLADFVLSNNKNQPIDVRINSKTATYEELCEVLDKSEMLLDAKGLTKHGATVSQEAQGNSRGHGNPEMSNAKAKE